MRRKAHNYVPAIQRCSRPASTRSLSKICSIRPYYCIHSLSKVIGNRHRILIHEQPNMSTFNAEFIDPSQSSLPVHQLPYIQNEIFYQNSSYFTLRRLLMLWQKCYLSTLWTMTLFWSFISSSAIFEDKEATFLSHWLELHVEMKSESDIEGG